MAEMERRRMPETPPNGCPVKADDGLHPTTGEEFPYGNQVTGRRNVHFVDPHGACLAARDTGIVRRGRIRAGHTPLEAP